MAICSDRLSKKKEETLVDPPSNLEVRDYSCVQPSWATPPCRAECSSVPPRDRLFQASHGLEGLPSRDSQTICADEMLFEGVSGIYSRPRKILEWREMIIIVCGSIPQQISSQTFIYLFFHYYFTAQCHGGQMKERGGIHSSSYLGKRESPYSGVWR